MLIRRSPNGARHPRPQAGRDRPEWVVAINRNAWSQSIGIAGRNHPVRAVDLATKHSLPVASSGEFGEAGALIGYGADFHEMCKLAALFVDKILRGVKPADLPVDRASKFETVLNMRAAKTLGLSLPSLALLRADRVIE